MSTNKQDKKRRSQEVHAQMNGIPGSYPSLPSRRRSKSGDTSSQLSRHSKTGSQTRLVASNADVSKSRDHPRHEDSISQVSRHSKTGSQTRLVASNADVSKSRHRPEPEDSISQRRRQSKTGSQTRLVAPSVDRSKSRDRIRPEDSISQGSYHSRRTATSVVSNKSQPRQVATTSTLPKSYVSPQNAPISEVDSYRQSRSPQPSSTSYTSRDPITGEINRHNNTHGKQPESLPCDWNMAPSEILNLCDLTEEEKVHLEDVLRRDEEFRKKEDGRLRRLKHHYSRLQSEAPAIGGEYNCHCCGHEFTILINPGTECRSCELKACKECIMRMGNTPPVCRLCYQKGLTEAKCNTWFLTSLLDKTGDAIATGTDLLRLSLEQVGAQSVPPSIVTTADSEGLNPSTSSRGKKKTSRKRASMKDSEDGSTLRGHPDGTSLTSSRASSEISLTGFGRAGDTISLGIDVTGEVYFGLDYDDSKGQFVIMLKRAKDLAMIKGKPKKDSRETKHTHPDPYVKTYLLPDKSKTGKRKTKPESGTSKPIFDTTIKYDISRAALETRTLALSIWHREAFGHNIFLGETHVPLDYHDFDDKWPQWYPLKEKVLVSKFGDKPFKRMLSKRFSLRRTQKCTAVPMPLLTYKGDLLLAIRYNRFSSGTETDSVSNQSTVTHSGELEVWVKEARNLVAVSSKSMSNPFLVGQLLPDKKSSLQKTTIISKTINPRWDYIISFSDVCLHDLSERALQLTIYSKDSILTKTYLGGVRLNLGPRDDPDAASKRWLTDAEGQEMTMWKALLELPPGTWIEGKLLLRPEDQLKRMDEK